MENENINNGFVDIDKLGELNMMGAAYDSPLDIIFREMEAKIDENAKKFDEMCFQAIWETGIHVDKDKLIQALKNDKQRYEEAYRKGRENGYKIRDGEIVRCKECWKHKLGDCPFVYWSCENIIPGDNWFCADGERRTDDG